MITFANMEYTSRHMTEGLRERVSRKEKRDLFSVFVPGYDPLHGDVKIVFVFA